MIAIMIVSFVNLKVWLTQCISNRQDLIRNNVKVKIIQNQNVSIDCNTVTSNAPGV